MILSCKTFRLFGTFEYIPPRVWPLCHRLATGMSGLHLALSSTKPPDSEKRISLLLFLSLRASSTDLGRLWETNLRKILIVNETRRRWAELLWSLHVSSSRVSPQCAPTTTIVHIPPPSCLIQHRIPADGQRPARSFKAFYSPWVSAFVVTSGIEWSFSTARQLLAISQPCSSIFTLPPDGPPHRFPMPCSPPRSKDFESLLHCREISLP